MNLEIGFANEAQRSVFYARERNQCFSGGFNNGKSFIGCFKLLVLLTTFPRYRAAICRQVGADLKKTTRQTFFKICPKELILSDNQQDGVTTLINGSVIFWLHLDKVDESTLRGLEINSVLVDQAEEIEEKVFDILQARVGRWDDAEIPQNLLDENPNWPRNEKTGKYIAPSYFLLLCNPDTQFHFIYRKFHPDSLDRNPNYFFAEGEWDSGLGSSEGYADALLHDDEWKEKYIRGKWGISNAQIHRLLSESLLDYSAELVDEIKRKGNLFRAMDHGETSPTCCLWAASYKGVYIFYREYYLANEVISKHRANIVDLSAHESYAGSYADPSIFYVESQKNGGFWTVSDEYLTRDIAAPPISWIAADNNEFATRNRINELLRESGNFKHPITGKDGSPGIYFIKRSDDYPNGCYHSITQLQSQRRKLIGYHEGKAIYDDAREDSLTDHAYDPIRYFIAMHGTQKPAEHRKVPRNSIKWFKNQMKKNKQLAAGSAVAGSDGF